LNTFASTIITSASSVIPTTTAFTIRTNPATQGTPPTIFQSNVTLFPPPLTLGTFPTLAPLPGQTTMQPGVYPSVGTVPEIPAVGVSSLFVN
jgi:hypothetical protein